MRIGVDVGGTFTDVVTIDEATGIRFVKTPSTPDDPGRGVLDGLKLLAHEIGRDLPDLLAETSVFIHGTTVATNILVQRNGAKVGLITTAGFRDLLELREGTKSARYRLRDPFPPPLVLRPLRQEVKERVTAHGKIETPLDERAVRAAVASLRAQHVEAVVVCFLHSHRNPAHEIRVRELIQESGWSPFISLSHEILAKEGEYDRLSSSVVNAYVGPGLSGYLERLSNNLIASGVQAPLLIMQSTGGVLPAVEAGQRSVGAVTSGPAGGAMAAAMFARNMGLDRVVSYDTGGTSTDVCVIEDGTPIEKQAKHLAEIKIAVPAIEINPLAVGGGSIAHIDKGGILSLGPKSAGAVPGPACFMRGGKLPTLADANVVLGYIATSTFLGGRLSLSRDAAAEAIRAHIASPLGLSVEAAALAIHQLATSKITEGIRLATVRRGADPRDYALLSFGGAGGLHTSGVARELEIPRAIIPREASVLSALGFLATDVRHDFHRSIGQPIRNLSGEWLKSVLAGLTEEGQRRLAKDGFDKNRSRLRFIADCRYARQVYSIPVDVDADIPAEQIVENLQSRFEANYEALYHHVHANESGVIDTVRLAAFGALPQLAMREIPIEEADRTPAQRGSRQIYLSDWMDCPMYWFDDLLPRMTISGPSLVESASTSILLHAGDEAHLDSFRSLHIYRGIA